MCTAVNCPHYFKYVVNGDESAQPKLEHVRDLDSSDPKSYRQCTGLYRETGSAAGTVIARVKVIATQTRMLASGRMVELIKRGGTCRHAVPLARHVYARNQAGLCCF